jgi:hypothetical protein
MRQAHVGAHDECMFIAYSTAQLLVAERQRELRDEARTYADHKRWTRRTTSDQPSD